MAKIKFGMMMTDARGKLGGQVFSKNRGGSYVRTKVTPSNPRTVAQMFSRSILGVLSVKWNALTDAQRSEWNNAVEDWQKTDIFGDIKKPTGKNLFVGINKNLAGVDFSNIVVPAQKMELPVISEVSFIYNTITGSLTITGLNYDDDYAYQISATPRMNAGVSFYKNRLRVIGALKEGTTAGADVLANYIAKYGAIEPNGNVYFSVRAIGVNGQAGVPMAVKLVYILDN